MRNNDLARSCGMGLVAVLVLAGGAWAGPPGPPPLDIPDAAIQRSETLTSFADPIAARIKYWCDMIRDANSEDPVIRAREGLVADYGKYTNATVFQFLFAKEAAKQLPPLLDLKDQLKGLKQINVTMAMSRMTSASSQDALDKMVAHENPGVRYLAWKGYLASRTAVLAQSRADIDRLFASLKDRAAKEPSVAVMGVIFQMLRLPATRPPGVPEKDYLEAQKKVGEVLAAGWPKLCQQVAAGDAEVTEAIRAGAEAWGALGEWASSDKAALKKALQSLVDMGWCAASSYATSKDSLQELDAVLLRDCEGALNAVKKAQKKYVETALSDPSTPPPRSAAVKLAVLKWATDLKEDGVVEPAEPAPTTAPTTGTAGP